jgi:hypothetical protein
LGARSRGSLAPLVERCSGPSLRSARCSAEQAPNPRRSFRTLGRAADNGATLALSRRLALRKAGSEHREISTSGRAGVCRIEDGSGEVKCLENLLEQKSRMGFLSDQDALDYLHYVRASEDGWTDETFKQLTAFVLGKPVAPGFKFQVVAGKPVEQINRSTTHKSVISQFEARNARKAARQQRWRLRKTALQATQNQHVEPSTNGSYVVRPSGDSKAA